MSNDNTFLIAKKYGAQVLSNSKRLGYNDSLESGIKAALNYGFSHVVTIDADGELSPTYLKEYLKLFKKSKIIFGKRKRKPRVSELIICKYFYKLYGVKDITCGMKGLELSLIKNINFKTIDKNLGLTIFNHLLRKKHLYSQCLVSGKARIGETRYGSGLKSSFKIISSLFSFIFENHVKEYLSSFFKRTS